MLGLENYGSEDEEERPKIETKPPASTAIKKKPVKFTVGLAKRTEEDEDSPRPAKRPRTTGSGKSTLLSMLPPPTKSTTAPSTSACATQEDFSKSLGSGAANLGVSKPDLSTSLVPPSVQKATASASTSDSATDFFSLHTSRSKPTTKAEKSAVPTVASAPAVSDFQPPEPTAEDEYPGYYQLPSGQWAQYDSEYYRSFWKRKQNVWDAQYGGVAEKGFENAEEEAMEVSAADQLNHAQKLREEKKNLTKNAGAGPVKPNMNMEAPKGSRARYRHQLTALLSEAYEKREELEEKIAQARRNRKDAGNKYGF